MYIEIVNDRKTVIEVGEDVVNSITNKELDLHHLKNLTISSDFIVLGISLIALWTKGKFSEEYEAIMTQQLQRVEEKIDKIREQDFFAAVKHIKTAFDHCKKCNSETREEHKNAAQEHFKLALEKVYSGYSPLSFDKKIDITKLGIVASIDVKRYL